MKHPLDELNEFVALCNSEYPNSFVLSTCVNNTPDSRIVLAKRITRDGIYFYTNYNSAKGHQIIENQNVSALFYFADFSVQVRVSGVAFYLPSQMSDNYFSQRDYLSKIGAWSSSQSKHLSSRIILIAKVIRNIFRHGEDPKRPMDWGGYIIVADKVEIMTMKGHRLHDRKLYEKIGHGAWKSKLLYP